jgi:hypothetical protein
MDEALFWEEALEGSGPRRSRRDLRQTNVAWYYNRRSDLITNDGKLPFVPEFFPAVDMVLTRKGKGLGNFLPSH